MTKCGGKSDNTRERILDAALTIFTEKGYEEATVRMILQASDTVAGSFYHFFSSKASLFEAVIERYLTGYAERFAAIADDLTRSAPERLEAILAEVAKGIEDYFGTLQGNKLHWTVQYALHEKTISAILPSVERMLEAVLQDGTVRSKWNADVKTLSAVLVKGTEGILHTRPMESLNKRQLAELQENVKEYVGLLLQYAGDDGGTYW